MKIAKRRQASGAIPAGAPSATIPPPTPRIRSQRHQTVCGSCRSPELGAAAGDAEGGVAGGVVDGVVLMRPVGTMRGASGRV
jgi:hypothetical protein